jgi:hypothetical protein
VAFGRLPDHDSSKLATCLASWISDYVSIYFPSVNLAVCFECGKFFSRERRDNVYCSKTCQNRVAYKRKKIFESGALSRVNVSPDDVWEMKPGLWIHHPRLGVGLIENVEHGGKTLASMLDSAGAAKPDPRYKSFMARTVRVRSRFLHSVRILGFSDLFEPQKKEEQLPTFHEVKSAETLTELL